MLSVHHDTPPPCPARFNMAEHVMAAGRATPDAVALEVIGRPGEVVERWTYGALDAAIGAVAGGLAAQGLRPGGRVALRLGNDVEFPLVFFGAQRLGAVPVALSSALSATELVPMLADVAPDLIAWDGVLALPKTDAPVVEAAGLRGGEVLPAHDTGADDPAYIVFTSGSSGRAKAVVHAHRAAHARLMMWDGWYGLQASDSVLHAGAFNWTFTLGTGLTDPWAAGARALVHVGGGDIVDVIAAHRPTIFAAVPGIYRRTLKSDRDLRTDFAGLRHGLAAGESLQPALRAEWRARTGTDLHEALGMSECSTFVSSCPARPAAEGRVGWPQPGRHVAVLGDEGPVARGAPGELAVHADDPGLMLGYLGDAPPAGWFRTGDGVVMEADGAIRYLGRLDDLLTVGGYRIAPLEVEAAMLACAGVAEAGVCEVSPKPGVRILAGFFTGSADPEDVKRDLAARLASYKIPKHIGRVADLPRGATGKLRRAALPDLFQTETRP